MMLKANNRCMPVCAFLLVITVNILANALPIAGRTTGEVSGRYHTLFTPAGYTFSIWSIIYLGLLAYVVYQALPAQRESREISAVNRMFIINCLANAAWLFAWHYEQLIISLGLMAVILATLVRIRLRLACRRDTSFSRYLCMALPFSLYTGWISVAAIANLSVVQTALDWNDAGLSNVTWTLFKLAAAGVIAAAVILRRGDPAFGLVIAWAAFGIAVKQSPVPAVAGAALMLAILVLLLIILQILRKSAFFRPAS